MKSKSETEKLIRSLVEKYFAEGKADKLKTEGIAELKTLLRRNNIPFSQVRNQINPLIKKIEKELYGQFASERLQPFEAGLRSELKKIIDNTSHAATVSQQKIRLELIKLLNEQTGSIEAAIEKRLRRIKIEERHIETEIFTTKLALNNLKRAAEFKNGGVQHLRYAGPSGTERPFCKEHINRVYKIQEAEKIKNHFGQPALVYAGGYNCRHRWVPVYGETEGENLFVDQSWKEKLESSDISKNNKKIMQNEKEFARRVSKLGYKIELNYNIKDKDNRDTDLVFEGKYSQLKQPKTSRDRAIKSSLTHHQADTLIIEIPTDLEQPNRSVNRIKMFIDKYPEKRVYLYNKSTNSLVEIKND